MTQYIVITPAPPRRHRPVGGTLEGHSDCGLLSAAADRSTRLIGRCTSCNSPMYGVDAQDRTGVYGACVRLQRDPYMS
jgi:hypothetical protein